MLACLTLSFGVVKSQNTCPNLYFQFSDTTLCNGDTLKNIRVYSSTNLYRVQLVYNINYFPNAPYSYYLGQVVHPSIPFEKINDTLYVATFAQVAMPDFLFPIAQVQPDVPILAIFENYPSDGNPCLPAAKVVIRTRPRPYPATLSYEPLLCVGQPFNSLQLAFDHDYYQQIWTNDNPNIGLPSSGKNVIPGFTAINNLGVDQTARITIHARAIDGRNGCTVPPSTITIRVNKEKLPVIMPLDYLITCKGDSVAEIKPKVLNDPWKIHWKQWGTVLSKAPLQGEGNLPTFLADFHNYYVSPYMTLTYFEFQAESIGHCLSKPEKFSLILRPVAKVDSIPDYWLCNGAKSPTIKFKGNAAEILYRWSIDNPSLGLPLKGMGDIPSKLLRNTSGESLKAKVTVTPKMPSRIWTSSLNDTWQILTPGAPQEKSIQESHFSTNGVQVPHPRGHEIYYSDGENPRIGIDHCHILCDDVIPPIGLDHVPQNLLAHPEGQKLFSLNHDQHSLTEVDIIGHKVLRKFNLPDSISCSALSDDGNILYAASKRNPVIWVIQTSSLSLLETIQLPGLVSTILPFPDGKGLSLKYTNEDKVVLWDFMTQAVVASFKVSRQSKAMVHAKAVNKLYLFEEQEYPNKILIVDLQKKELIKTMTPTSNTGQYLNGSYQMAVNSSGDQVFLNTYFFSYIDTYQDTLLHLPWYSAGKRFFVSDEECEATPRTFTITLGNNAEPATITPFPTQFVCLKGKSAEISFNQLYPNIDFKWEKYLYDRYSPLPQAGTGNIPAADFADFALENDYETNYTVYPSFKVQDSVCRLDPIQIKYYVLGTYRNYYVPQRSKQVLCKDDTTTAIKLHKSSNYYSRWINNNPATGIPIAGTNDFPALPVQNASNTSAVSNIFLIHERQVNDLRVCPDTFPIVEVVVLPYLHPVADQVPDYAVCHRDSSEPIAFSSNEQNTRFRWKILSGPEIGMPLIGEGNIPSFVADAPGDRNQFVEVELTPVVRLANDSCVGLVKKFKIEVKSRAILPRVEDLGFCNGEDAYIPFSGANQYQWSFSRPDLIEQFYAVHHGFQFDVVNPGVVLQTGLAQISYAFPGQTCKTDTTSFKINIYPRPVLPQLEDRIYLCTGEIFTGLNFSNPLPDFELRWTNSNPNIGLGDSGLGNLPSFTAKGHSSNFLNSTLKIQIVAKVPVPATCALTEKSIAVSVAPRPVLARFPNNQTVPNCAQVFIPDLGSNVPFTEVQWTNNQPSLGLQAKGQGNIPPFLATNTALELKQMKLVVQSRIFTGLNEKYCAGTLDSFTISVLPSTILPSIDNQSYCLGEVTKPISFGKLGLGQTVRWHVSEQIGLPLTGTGDIPAFAPSILAQGRTAQIRYNIEYPEEVFTSFSSNNTSGSIGWFGAKQNFEFNSDQQPLTGIWDLFLHPDGKRIFATSLGSSSIAVLDGITKRYLSTIEPSTNQCYTPSHLEWSKDGTLLYISYYDCSSIFVLAADSYQVLGKISVDRTIGAFTLSPGGFRMYVFTEDGKKMFLVNPRAFTILKEFPLNLEDGNISKCFADPDGEKVFVLSFEQQMLFRLNLSTAEMEIKLKLKHQPNDLCFVPQNNTVYLASLRGGLFSFDRKASEPDLHYIPSSKSVGTCDLSRDKEVLYASQPDKKQLLLVSTRTNTVIDSLRLFDGVPYHTLVLPAWSCIATPGVFNMSIGSCLTPGKEQYVQLNEVNLRRNLPEEEVPILESTANATVFSSDQSSIDFLGQNIPNPFTSNTIVPFFLHQTAPTQFQLFSIDGKLVYSEKNTRSSGWHEIKLDATLLKKPGLYFYTLKTPLFFASKKMIWVKE